jgi:hypothetical protein
MVDATDAEVTSSESPTAGDPTVSVVVDTGGVDELTRADVTIDPRRAATSMPAVAIPRVLRTRTTTPPGTVAYIKN